MTEKKKAPASKEPPEKVASPLDGIKVIDWTIMQAGPAATAVLGDMGAQVIKIEEKDHGDLGRGLRRVYGVLPSPLAGGRTWYFETFNRNKRSIALNLKKKSGQEIVHRLVEKADVFVQSFRPGVAARLGLDYATLQGINRRIIYANALGFGRRGPDGAMPAFDTTGQARGGFMTQVGEPEMPPIPGPPGMSDTLTGTNLAFGIVTALLARERTGIGQEVDASLLSSTIWLQQFNISYQLLTGKDCPRFSRSAAGNPLWNHYQCKDGNWICFVMVQSERFWPDFCRALGIPELEHDTRFNDAEDRQKNCRELVSVFDAAFAKRTRDEWIAILRQGDFMFGAVNTIPQVTEDLQVIANEYIVDFDHPVLGKVKVVNSPVTFSKMSSKPRFAAPELGQHTEEILGEIGYSWDDICLLRDEGVI